MFTSRPRAPGLQGELWGGWRSDQHFYLKYLLNNALIKKNIIKKVRVFFSLQQARMG